MLPPIHKFAASSLSSTTASSSSGGANSYNVGDDRLVLSDRVVALERQHELMRQELVHVKKLLSGNQKHDDTDSILRVGEELQRLNNSFVSKLQSDVVFQQREQQKAALLFAEVCRLGQRVDAVENQLKNYMQDNKADLELLSSRIVSAHDAVMSPRPVVQVQAPTPPPLLVLEPQQQEPIVAACMNQLRSQLFEELPARFDLMIDSKVTMQMERFVCGAMVLQKQEMLRFVQQQLDFAMANEMKRHADQLNELSLIKERLFGLENRLVTENAQVRRFFEWLVEDNSLRIERIAQELQLQVEFCHEMATTQQDALESSLMQLYQMNHQQQQRRSAQRTQDQQSLQTLQQQMHQWHQELEDGVQLVVRVASLEARRRERCDSVLQKNQLQLLQADAHRPPPVKMTTVQDWVAVYLEETLTRARRAWQDESIQRYQTDTMALRNEWTESLASRESALSGRLDELNDKWQRQLEQLERCSESQAVATSEWKQRWEAQWKCQQEHWEELWYQRQEQWDHQQQELVKTLRYGLEQSLNDMLREEPLVAVMSKPIDTGNPVDSAQSALPSESERTIVEQCVRELVTEVANTMGAEEDVVN